MLGSMATLVLPKGAPGSVTAEPFDRDRLVTLWFRERGIETWFHDAPLPLLRISAQIYNDTGAIPAPGRACCKKRCMAS
jgi:hypothetical protein